MQDLTVVQRNLPATVDDLAKFVLVGREKLVAVRAEIRAIDKVGLAQEVREQKLQEAQAISEAVLDAEVKIGELMAQVPKATKDNARKQIDSGVDLIKPKADVIRDAGFTQKQVERFQTLAAHPDIVEQAKAEARENDDIVSRSLVLNMVKAQKKADEIERARASVAEQQRQDGAALLFVEDGIDQTLIPEYDLLLTDPPYSTDTPNIDEFVDRWLYKALDKVKPTGFAYIFIGAYPAEMRAYLNAKTPHHIHLEQVLVWTYKNTLGNNPKDRYKQNWQACLFYRGENAPALDCPLTNEQWAVQEINAPDGRQGDRFHAWQKPMEIAERFIRHSTKAGAVVFDPFACTGTFLLAAAKLGRNGVGFEIDSHNAAIAKDRGCVLSTDRAF